MDRTVSQASRQGVDKLQDGEGTSPAQNSVFVRGS